MRINWIDNIRWLGILLIVLWHTVMPEWSILTKYIFSFHVVLFFILSWLLFKQKKEITFSVFLKNKFVRLIIPFIFFNIIFFIIAKLEWKLSTTRIIDFTVWMIYWDYLWDNWGYMNNTGGFNLVNVSTWFLPALFLTSIYYYGINYIFKNKLIKIILLILLSLLIFIESKYTIFRLPWSAEIALMMTLFYGLAHTFKDEIFKVIDKIKLQHLWAIPLILLLQYYTLNSVNISTNSYWNYIFLILNSLVGFLTFAIISKNIWSNKILSFFWKNSIIILWFEWIKVEIIENIHFLSFGLLQYNRWYFEWFTQFVITIVFLIPIIWIVNKYLPFIIWGWYKKNS